MNLTLDSINLIATVTDFDIDDWNANSSTIPSDYTINFIPMVDETTLNSLNTGRSINYTQQTVYSVTPLGNGYVSAPSIVITQQLLPVPAQTDSGS